MRQAATNYGFFGSRLHVAGVFGQFSVQETTEFGKSHANPIIWVNYNDLTATEPWKSWLVREIIPKWP